MKESWVCIRTRLVLWPACLWSWQPALALGLVAVNERGLCLSICGRVGSPHPFLCGRRSLWNFPPTPTKKSGVSYTCSLLSLLKTLNCRNIFYSRYIPMCFVKPSVFSLFGESGISWHGDLRRHKWKTSLKNAPVFHQFSWWIHKYRTMLKRVLCSSFQLYKKNSKICAMPGLLALGNQCQRGRARMCWGHFFFLPGGEG